MTLPTVVVILAKLFGCLSLVALGDVMCVWLRSRDKASLLSLRRQIRKAECANDSRGSLALAFAHASRWLLRSMRTWGWAKRQLSHIKHAVTQAMRLRLIT
jgi:hypothetical protein